MTALAAHVVHMHMVDTSHWKHLTPKGVVSSQCQAEHLALQWCVRCARIHVAHLHSFYIS
jgi:hypothetical protein